VVLSGTPASSTTKTGRHDIAEILLKVALNTKNQSNNLGCKNIPLQMSKWNVNCKLKDRQHNDQKKKHKQRSIKHYTRK
jgi:hypothetical protein